MKTKSALSYFGSDSEVASQLAAMLDHCRHVTIPFVGGASILPHLKAKAIVCNDLHDLAIGFYRLMSTNTLGRQRLIARCQHTLSHPAEMELAKTTIQRRTAQTSQVDLAWAFWAMCWIGRKGQGGTKNQGGAPSVRWTADGGNNASRIRAAAADLAEWAVQFERCEWKCCCFRELLPQVADKPQCGLYCDPPWVEAGDGYLHPFDVQAHQELAGLLSRFESTTVVVRYGDHPLIRELYGDWNIIPASSRNQHNVMKGELWITNQEI